MKYIKTYEESFERSLELSQPEYYINAPNYYTQEQKDEFKFWYNKIKPALDNNNELLALNILLDWNKECLQKFDMYSLVMNYSKVQKDIYKYNL